MSTAPFSGQAPSTAGRVPAQPDRVLTTRDAVAIGLGSMLGAGVFTVYAPAAAEAGPWLLLGLAAAALVAAANATSSAQLAAQYPSAGGTFVYGRERLGPWPGFLAGWGFIIGKTASCAAMAMVVAANLLPALAPNAGPLAQKAVAILAILGMTAANCRGITKTAALTKGIVAVVLVALAALLLGLWGTGRADLSAVGLTGTSGSGAGASTPAGPDLHGILQAAGLMFFAFAGYARIATMGAEVRDPRRSIPRAIVIALSIVVVIYAVLGLTVLASLGPVRLATSSAPVSDAAALLGARLPLGLVAALAALGALLGLLAGVGRTAMAMAQAGELPAWLGELHPRFKVPARAELTFAAIMCGVVLAADVRGAIGFSSFGVLVYYAVANVSALTQTGTDRLYPKAVQWAGVAGCAILAVSLPAESVLAGVAVFVLGAAYRMIRSPS